MNEQAMNRPLLAPTLVEQYCSNDALNKGRTNTCKGLQRTEQIVRTINQLINQSIDPASENTVRSA